MAKAETIPNGKILKGYTRLRGDNMRVLYVVGSCLTKNTSANMSHNAYVQGLLENGCNVDILMAKDSWGQQDSKLPVWEQASYYCYPSISQQDKVRTWFRKLFPSPTEEAGESNGTSNSPRKNAVSMNLAGKQSIKEKLRSKLKWLYYRCFPNDPLYPLDSVWLKNASRFQSTYEYDLVVSNSSPAASHKLVLHLLQSKRLSCRRWIQIWEDPWYADLYSSYNQTVFQEEHVLLSAASEAYYVSPLTLRYQKELFPDCEQKMKHIPLPYLIFSQEKNTTQMSFGYFGDYYSHTRNLLPFYQALRKSGYAGNIYGDSDLKLEATNQIVISGRVTLDILAQVQVETGILVHLCNLRGGQIPGKIYHYSATRKPILFILDGTNQEQKLIRSYFEQFDRYYFCENTVDSILMSMKKICADFAESVEYEPVKAFSPKTVVGQLLCK